MLSIIALTQLTRGIIKYIINVLNIKNRKKDTRINYFLSRVYHILNKLEQIRRYKNRCNSVTTFDKL